MPNIDQRGAAAAPAAAVTISPLRILAGLALGLFGGAGLAGTGFGGLGTLLAIAQPVGRLWLDGLTMTVVPLVFGLLVTGIAAAAGQAASGRLTRRTLLCFAALLIGACAVSALLSTLGLAILPIPTGTLSGGAAGVAPPPLAAPGEWFTGIVPTNPIKAAADTAMVPLVVFALVFGFAVARIAANLRDAIVTLLRAVVEAMLVIVQWVLWLAPLGVFALAFGVGARLGVGAAGTLLHYALFVAAICLVTGLLAYPLVLIAGRLSPIAFARAALPSQVVALGTQSSLASLPAMIRAGEALGVSQAAGAVVLPLAVSIFRAASAAANVAVSVYLAHLHGIALGPGTLALGVVVAAAVSLAAVGLPAQVSFFATIGPVCLAMGVPIDLLPLLLAVETIPDIFRTLGNVTVDLAVARIVGRDVAPIPAG